MKFSYNFLQTFFERKLPAPEKLAKFLTMKSFEVKEIEKTENDFVLDIDILPNRGDCLSHLGIAREISAILNLKIKIPEQTINEDRRLKIKDLIDVEIKDSKFCTRYNVRMLTDIKVEPSPSWLRKRLKNCGLKSINNIVDIVNYVMLELGQPLHAFDYDKIESYLKNKKRIIVRQAKRGETILALDGDNYGLDKDILVIADKNGPIAIAGIKGGKRAEIDENTKRIVLESANFSARGIRLASKKIDLKTDASLRFEYGIDPNLTNFAINRATFLLQKFANAKAISGLVDFYPKKILPKIIKLDFSSIKKILGVDIPAKIVFDIFKKLGLKIISQTKTNCSVEAPTFRQDLSLQEDLIEEIGRLWGYEKIPVVFPVGTLIPTEKNIDLHWEGMAKNILKELGMTEVYNYSFIGEREKEAFNFKNLIEIENPISAEYRYLRPSLIPNLLKNIKKNQRFYNEIKIFEIGKIFPNLIKKEKKMLTGMLTGDVFFETKGIVDILLEKMGIPKVWYDDFQPTSEESEISIWHPKRCAEIKIDNVEVGFLGEISPKIISELKLKGKVCVFDLDFEKIQKLASEEIIYRPISLYPASVRDIAVLVPVGTKTEEVLNKIEIAGGELLIDVDLFDIYEGENLPEGKKNLAFHLIFQATGRVLSSTEIQNLQNKIFKALEEEGWEPRK